MFTRFDRKANKTHPPFFSISCESGSPYCIISQKLSCPVKGFRFVAQKNPKLDGQRRLPRREITIAVLKLNRSSFIL